MVNDAGELVEHTAAPPDADGLRHLVERLGGVRVRAVIESMTGARLCTTRSRDVDDVRPSVPGQRSVRPRRPRAARPHRDPDPWRRDVDASLELIDDLELQIASLTCELKRQGADHRYIPLLVTAPGFGWINAYTVASEIGDIARFPSPAKLCGYTGLCPRVYQSGSSDRRGPISKQGSRYLRWALFEAALHACTHPAYAERYQRTKKRLGKQRGPKVAQIDLSRKLTEAIWHMLTRNQPFALAGAPFRKAALFGFKPGFACLLPAGIRRRYLNPAFRERIRDLHRCLRPTR